MSNLNQAFIRAYAKESPAETRGLATAPRSKDAAPTEAPVRPLSPEGVFHLLDPPNARSQAGPHLRIVAADDASELLPEPTVAPTAAKQYAAATALPPSARASHALSPTAAPLQPAWQVDRLLWPAACDAIAARIAQPLDALCAELGRYSRLGQKVVCLSSCHAGEGRTSVLFVLARRLATRGLRVAMVDGHFAAPTVAEQLGLAPTAGWPELLSQDLPLDESLVESLDDGLAVLPAAEPLEHDAVARHPRVGAVVRQLRSHFDLVLVDTGPLGQQAVASFSASPVSMFRPDAAILVRDARATAPEQLQSAVRALRAAGVSTWGVVENFLHG